MRKVIAIISDVNDENNFKVVTDDGLAWEWTDGKWWHLGYKEPNYPSSSIPNIVDQNDLNNTAKSPIMK